MSSKYRATPDKPVTDADRDELTTRVNDAYTDGKLGDEDYHARLDRIWAAATLGELVPVVEGLPPVATHDVPAIVAAQDGPGPLAPSGRPGELAPITGPGRSGLVLLGVGGAALILLVVLLVVLL